MGLTESQEAVAARIREKAPGEILRLDPGVKGFLVVQQLPDDPQPILYRVTLEKQIDGSESLHWAYLGPSNESDDASPEDSDRASM
ncbi:MAG: hypothetical protein ABEK59_01475 [Halobacteria archaeon]